MNKEKLIRKKIRELENLTGTDLSNLERELMPHKGEELKPLTVKKKKT